MYISFEGRHLEYVMTPNFLCFLHADNPLLISTIAMAIGMVVCVTISAAVIVAQLKVKAKIQAELDRANGVIPRQSQKRLSKIDITENVAYGMVRRVY